MKQWLIRQAARAAAVVMLGMFIAVGAAQAQDQTKDQDRDRTRDQIQDRTRDQTQLQDPIKAQDRDRDRDQIFGSQLMTRKERAEYQKQMRALKTEQEREQFRLGAPQKNAGACPGARQDLARYAARSRSRKGGRRRCRPRRWRQAQLTGRRFDDSAGARGRSGAAGGVSYRISQPCFDPLSFTDTQSS